MILLWATWLLLWVLVLAQTWKETLEEYAELGIVSGAWGWAWALDAIGIFVFLPGSLTFKAIDALGPWLWIAPKR